MVLVHHPKIDVKATYQGKSEMQGISLANGTETQTDWKTIDWKCQRLRDLGSPNFFWESQDIMLPLTRPDTAPTYRTLEGAA